MMMGPVNYLALAAGDRVVSEAGPDTIFGPGPDRWYALTVRPQAEDLAETWLDRRGVYAFHPVLTRQATRFGRIKTHVRRYLPGYVFAKVPGDPVVHRFVAGPYITGALSRADGQWGILQPSQLRAIHAMRHRHEAAEARTLAEQQRRRRRTMIRAGDRILFQAGLFAGQSCDVVEIKGPGRAMVRLSLFGQEALIEADAGDMIKLAS
jgi:transcription antitermination factor NusG